MPPSQIFQCSARTHGSLNSIATGTIDASHVKFGTQLARRNLVADIDMSECLMSQNADKSSIARLAALQSKRCKSYGVT